jgi:hypothetical protein
MSEEMDLSQFNPKKLARLGRIKIIIAVALGLFFLIMLILKSSNAPEEKQSQIVEEAPEKIKTTTDIEDIDGMWRETIEKKVERQKSKTEIDLTALNESLKKEKEELEKKIKDSKDAMSVELNQTLNDTNKKLEYLAAELEMMRGNTSQAIDGAGNVKTGNSFKLNLKPQEELKYTRDKQLKTIDNYIPAGTKVRAKLWHGADVSTALSRAGDPDPLTIEVLDKADAPNGFNIDLQGCRIVAALHGEISNERGKIRLEKLSCVERSGEVIETEISGYAVAHYDAKLGLRGQVVSRDGKLIMNSFVGGALGGLAGTASKSQDYTPFALGMGAVQRPGFKEKLRDGLFEGTKQSADRIGKYYIDRAEQVQPVIEVEAKEVVLFFNEGVYIGDSNLREEITRKRDLMRKQNARDDANELSETLN